MLHDLVKLKQALTQRVNIDPTVDNLTKLRNDISNIRNQLTVIDPVHLNYIDNLVAYYDSLIQLTQKSKSDVIQYVSVINNQITEITHNIFANNYELEERYPKVDGVRNNRRITSNPEVMELVKQKILLYTNWRYPAMEIGCRDGEWTQYMVAADPLYILDRHQEFLDSTNNRFSDAYKNRLRKYHFLIDHDFSMLPANQFAFVFSWGYFNYISFDTMHQCLKQIYNLLRPGGIFMFSYNDGDTPVGAGMAENFARTYLPKSLLIPLCLSLGFTIVNEYDIDPGTISWLEIKKPGELKTIKAHQVLGEINRREMS